jgi:hypothetical protein
MRADHHHSTAAQAGDNRRPRIDPPPCRPDSHHDEHGKRRNQRNVVALGKRARRQHEERSNGRQQTDLSQILSGVRRARQPNTERNAHPRAAEYEDLGHQVDREPEKAGERGRRDINQDRSRRVIHQPVDIGPLTVQQPCGQVDQVRDVVP